MRSPCCCFMLSVNLCVALLLLPLLLPSLCTAQRVGELGLRLPDFIDKPGMLNCIRCRTYMAFTRVSVFLQRYRRVSAAHSICSHIEMGLHYGCSLVAASLKGLQSASLYQILQPEEHYARRIRSCVGSTTPPPPSDQACVQPANSITAPLFAEVAEWTSNVTLFARKCHA